MVLFYEGKEMQSLNYFYYSIANHTFNLCLDVKYINQFFALEKNEYVYIFLRKVGLLIDASNRIS